ncbi:hypothetical protein os4_22980 [Comamonadaceae bacterium OS-4]|nr:hypothetical protein os4_22980 [Comamonadaceae bacterium OS-4]
MVFHLGVLKLLAERGLLERVEKLSTVSGGSLVVGLVLHQTQLKWPTSSQFLSSVYPALRERLCARSLMWGAVRQLKRPSQWRFLLSRANLLAGALRDEWGLTEKLRDLPSTPEWSINGTTAENGKRFRFKREDMGDYLLGYAAPNDFPLANAIAVSAAFPGGFGPLAIKSNDFVWKRRPWGATVGTEEVVQLPYKYLHLYDGGVYDNLGLEPYFDAGKLQPKPPEMPIIVSDAGAPLVQGFSYGPFSLYRLKRVSDIISEQARSLRVRTFATYLQGAPARGAFMQISTPVGALHRKSAEFAATFPTTLRRLNTSEFDMLAGHGYEVTAQVERQFGLISPTIPIGILPR